MKITTLNQGKSVFLIFWWRESLGQTWQISELTPGCALRDHITPHRAQNPYMVLGLAECKVSALISVLYPWSLSYTFLKNKIISVDTWDNNIKVIR